MAGLQEVRSGTREAVVVVHGIGEQRPMTTLRGFVDGLFKSDNVPFFSLPDWADVRFELFTLIKPIKAGGYDKQIDFYEGYWAPDARGTRLTHVVSWGRQLLLRSPRTVPSRLQLLWWLALALVLVAGALVVAGAWELVSESDNWWATIAKFIGGAILSFLAGWAVSGLGDAARYLDDRPPKVEMRQTIRQRMVELLEYLHGSGRYERISVVGHFLGGVIAYDAVRLLWQRRMGRTPLGVSDRAVAKSGEMLLRGADGDGRSLEAFRSAQRRLCRDLSQQPLIDEAQAKELAVTADYSPRWLISDLVTVGSPIAYASLLLSSKAVSLSRRITERGLSTCPPQWAQDVVGSPTYCFDSAGKSYVHHGAVFAAVSWTNIFAEGDLIGGSVSAAPDDGALKADSGLGPGVLNIKVTRGPFVNVPLLSHSRYWKGPSGPGTSHRALTTILLDE